MLFIIAAALNKRRMKCMVPGFECNDCVIKQTVAKLLVLKILKNHTLKAF